jgi:uncharacterized repeat protein (TIGR03837 family)
LSKWFFYPGFTAATGGLLRETGLMAARKAWQANHRQHRAQWAASLGIKPPSPDTLWLSLFCYEPAPVGALLDGLAASGAAIQVLVTPGFATGLARQWQAAHPPVSTLSPHELPPISQAEFDHLLWACDLNFVRGEDSAVRALWAGQPHVWHIYPQDDGVHAGKLDAFMDRWMAGWPDDLAHEVRGLWLSWNGLQPAAAGNFAALPSLLNDPRWAASQGNARQRLAEIPDLVTRLCGFVSDRR